MDKLIVEKGADIVRMGKDEDGAEKKLLHALKFKLIPKRNSQEVHECRGSCREIYFKAYNLMVL